MISSTDAVAAGRVLPLRRNPVATGPDAPNDLPVAQAAGVFANLITHSTQGAFASSQAKNLILKIGDHCDMARINLRSRSAGIFTAICMLATTPPLAAAGELAPSDIAAAMLRQDAIRGVYEVIEAPDLDTVFVASTPSFDDGTPGFVDLLSAKDLELKGRIELPRRAFALGLDHKRGKLFVGSTLDGSLSILDAKTGALQDTVQLGRKDDDGFEHTRMIEVDEESGKVFVSSPSTAGTLWIVDADKGNAVQRIDNAGLWAAGLAHDPASGRVYVSGGGTKEILIVDGSSGERIGNFSTGDTTNEEPDASRHFFVNLALDGKGRRLFAADANSGQLYVFGTQSGNVLKVVPIGKGTLDVIYAEAFDQIFVTYRGADRENPHGTGGIVMLGGEHYAELTRIPLAAHPNSLAIGDHGKALLVTVKAPMEKTHPEYRENATDSVLRIDLEKLSALAH